MDATTFRFLKLYEDGPLQVQPFLSTLFKTPPENFYGDAEKVTADTIRSEPRIAVPNPGPSFGTRKVEMSKSVNKEYTPAIFDLETHISAYTKFKRRPGVSPFDPSSGGTSVFVSEAFRYMRELEAMNQRGIELMCAQVLRNGRIQAIDALNATVFDTDFGTRSAHKVTVGTNWGADGTGDPPGDVESLAEVILRNGKQEVDQAIFGRGAILRFMANTKVRVNLDVLHMNYGDVERPKSRNGATFHGTLTLGTRNLEIWSYRATYIDPVSGNHTPYLPDNEVILRSSTGRLDLTFGEIPLIAQPEARVQQFMPSRLSNPSRGFDMSVNTWLSPDGKQLMLSCGTRALPIPTAADTFGRLTVY